MLHGIFRFFDLLEDRIRGWLTRRPILYAIVGAIGIVLIWKGVEETAGIFPFLFGPVSLIVGLVILLATGLLVSFFTGSSAVLSEQKSEEKLVKKTESEVHTEEAVLPKIESELKAIHEEVKELSKK